jgi:hypothetical protein
MGLSGSEGQSLSLTVFRWPGESLAEVRQESAQVWGERK